VWSQKVVSSVSKGPSDPLSSIVSTLVSPLHKRKSEHAAEETVVEKQPSETQGETN